MESQALRKQLRDLGFDAPERPAEGGPWGHDAAADEALAPLAQVLPRTLDVLRRRCLATTSLRHHGRWLRVYVFDMDGHLALWAGGAPLTQPQLDAAWDSHALEIPHDLARVYAVHAGWGRLGAPESLWRAPALLPPESLTPLSQRVRFGLEDVLYNPAAYLVIASYGGDECQLMGRDGGVYRWHVADRELGPSLPLFSWLDSLMVVL